MSVRSFSKTFIVKLNRQIIPFEPETFATFTKMSEAEGELIANVGPSGRADIEWILDSDGKFYQLAPIGLMPRNPLQLLGLSRRKERLKLLGSKRVSVGDLQSIIGDVKDRYPEAQFVNFVRRQLRNYPTERLVDNEIVSTLLGD